MLNFLKGVFGPNKSVIEDALANGAVILDVRNRDEFQLGHIAGSKNIPLIELRQNLQLVRGWNKPVITVCVSGNRSGVAKSFLAEAGVEVYNGGSWQEFNNIKI